MKQLFLLLITANIIGCGKSFPINNTVKEIKEKKEDYLDKIDTLNKVNDMLRDELKDSNEEIERLKQKNKEE